MRGEWSASLKILRGMKGGGAAGFRCLRRGFIDSAITRGRNLVRSAGWIVGSSVFHDNQNQTVPLAVLWPLCIRIHCPEQFKTLLHSDARVLGNLSPLKASPFVVGVGARQTHLVRSAPASSIHVRSLGIAPENRLAKGARVWYQ
jgi:hypothetical protein